MCTFKKSFLSFLSVLLFSSPAFSNKGSCLEAFSKLEFQNKALKKIDKSLFPTHVDPVKDRKLVERWNQEPPSYSLLKSLLPEGAYFIPNQLYQPGTPTAVKLGEPGNSLIVRANYSAYEHRKLHTNVVFSLRALQSNMKSEKNWFVGEDAKAAILFLHGGGTKSTGAHVGSKFVNHFSHYDIDVVSIDLPWHAQGHREFVNFETDIRFLADFAHKYIPPHVPLYVWGHSWGSVFAEKIMMMTENSKTFFHKNLKGVMIMSTALDPAPGKSVEEKQEILSQFSDKVRSNLVQEKAAETEKDLWRTIVRDNKTSPLGGTLALSQILTIDQVIPKHKGRKYIPALMVVGTADSLVYLGYEKEYKERYKLENVERQFIDTATYYLDRGGPPRKVGHLLGDFVLEGKQLDASLAANFMNKVTGLEQAKKAIMEQLKNSKIDLEILEQNVYDRMLEDSFEFESLAAIFNQKKIKEELEPSILKEIIGIIEHESQISVHERFPQTFLNEKSSYFSLVQYFANDLAFREYLETARFFDRKKTRELTSFLGKEMPLILKRLIDKFYNYTNFNRRIGNVLSELELLFSPKKSEAKLSLDSAKKELAYLLTPEFVELIHNAPLSKEMQELRNELISKKPPPNKAILAKIVEIKEKYKGSLFYPANKSKKQGRQKLSPFIRRILSRDLSEEEAMEILKKQNLPPEVFVEIEPLYREYFTARAISESTYKPKWSTLENIGVRSQHKDESAEEINKRKERLKKDYEGLEFILSERQILEQDLNKTKKTLQKLSDKRQQLNSEVEQALKEIKIQLEKASINPPEFARVEYQKSAELFEKVMEAYIDMEKTLDAVTAYIYRGVELKAVEVTEILGNHRDKIDNFTLQYENYVQSRIAFTQKLITALEKGDRGDVAKQVVVKIYGYGSEGKSPGLGSHSIYLELGKITEEIAELESKKYHTEIRIHDLFEEQINVMNTLIHQLNLDDGPVSNHLRKVANMYAFIDMAAKDALINKSSSGDIQKEDIIHYLHKNRVAYDGIVGTWKRLKSDLPPALPTE